MTHANYFGLDVHKETISIAHALGGSREEPTYHGRCAGSIAAVTTGLQKLAAKINVEFSDLKVCYEVDCVLMSPPKTERKPSDRPFGSDHSGQSLEINIKNQKY